MKTRFLDIFLATVFLTLGYSSIHSQVGINTTSLDTSAALKIHGDSLGILLPRVNLLSPTDIVTVANPADGLLLFNTTVSPTLQEGYYYWAGSFWDVINTTKNVYTIAKYSNTNTSTDLNSFVLAPILGTEEKNDDSSLYVKLSGTSLRVTQAGRYQIVANLHLDSTVDDVQPFCRFRINGSYRGAISGSGHINIEEGHRNTSLNLYETFNLNANDVLTLQMGTNKSNFTSFDAVGTSTLTILKIR